MTRIILLIALIELVPVVLIALAFEIMARRKERHSASHVGASLERQTLRASLPGLVDTSRRRIGVRPPEADTIEAS